MKARQHIPLLHDHHTHPSVYGAMAEGIDLRDVTDQTDAMALIAAHEGRMVFVQGWNDSLYTFTPEELDTLPPVFICNTSLHSFLANTAAHEQLESTHPEIIANLDNPDWVERNLQAILKLSVDVEGCDASTLNRFYAELVAQGIWCAEEMLLPNQQVLEAYDEADLMFRTRLWADPSTFAALDEEARSKVLGIKLFTDGALGAHTAAMHEPLLSGERGILLYGDGDLRKTIWEAAETGKHLAAHAIGDRASGQLIEALTEVRDILPDMQEVRIEHAEFITIEQARAAKSLGLVLSMQPNFSSETIGYADRLSEKQCQRINPFRMLIDEVGFVPGEDLILGSDGMPHGVEFALQMSLFPPLASQRLTLEEFVAGYCMPDTSYGYIDVEIDEDARAVAIRDISIAMETINA